MASNALEADAGLRPDRETRIWRTRRKPAWELEQEARAINATDWQPLPGMVKNRCLRCRYVFPMKVEEAEVTIAPIPFSNENGVCRSGLDRPLNLRLPRARQLGPWPGGLIPTPMSFDSYGFPDAMLM
jgi:hypothetical protein